MLSVGLTGGIASGKSLVAGLFARRGGLLIDADAAAREAVLPGSPGLQAIVDAFGPDIITGSGELDREKLGSIVFSDPGKRASLDAILHPIILGAMFARTGELQRRGYAGIVVCDIPLLFECGLQKRFDATVVVYADTGTRIERLASRNGLSRQAARQRLDAQMPLSEKRLRADYVIDNNGSVAELEAGAAAVWAELSQRAQKKE